MSPGGRHGHTIRRLRRRIEAVLEEDQVRRQPIPPPISEEHAAMRERIERGLAALFDPVDSESADLRERLNERIRENPHLVNDAAQLVGLMREEHEFLADQGVDPRPYDHHEPKF